MYKPFIAFWPSKLCQRDASDKLEFSIGINKGEGPYVVTLRKNDPNVLVTAVPGAGLEQCLKSMIARLVMDNDPKHFHVAMFPGGKGSIMQQFEARLDHVSVLPVEDEPVDQLGLLNSIQQWLLFNQSGVCQMMFLDHIEKYLETPALKAAFIRLLEIGKERGVPVVCTTQALPPMDIAEIAPYFGCRISLRNTVEGSLATIGTPSAAFSPANYGYAWICEDITDPMHTTTCVQVPYIPDERLFDEDLLNEKIERGEVPKCAKTILSRIQEFLNE